MWTDHSLNVTCCHMLSHMSHMLHVVDCVPHCDLDQRHDGAEAAAAGDERALQESML
jgi:hypothetical protein